MMVSPVPFGLLCNLSRRADHQWPVTQVQRVVELILPANKAGGVLFSTVNMKKKPPLSPEPYSNMSFNVVYDYCNLLY